MQRLDTAARHKAAFDWQEHFWDGVPHEAFYAGSDWQAEQDRALLAQMAEALAMALHNCIRCNGSGTVRPRGGPQPCALCFPERQALAAYRSAVGAS
jgi:hypothetical protein